MNKDKEECTRKMSTVNEALANYGGRDENPPEKKVVQNATEAVTHAQETRE